MLIAEGVGRNLYPDINMWELALPLVEDWMMEELGPEARLHEATASVFDGLERLPALIAKMEGSIGMAARKGIRLNPESLTGLTKRSGGNFWKMSQSLLKKGIAWCVSPKIRSLIRALIIKNGH